MKQILKKKSLLILLMICSLVTFTGCSHDSDVYEKRNAATDAERIAHAEKVLGVRIDAEQDWVLTKEYSIVIKADADLDHICQVAVLSANPYIDNSFVLATAQLANGEAKKVTFLASVNDEVLYAACIANDGQCVVRPFVVGNDTEVSFTYQSVRAARRKSPSIVEPDYTTFDMLNAKDFLKGIRKALPEGQDNRGVIGNHNYGSTVQVRQNPYDTYGLGLAYIGGNSDAATDVAYDWFPLGQELGMASFLFHDNFPAGWGNFSKVGVTDYYSLKGYNLICRDAEETDSKVFSPGDILRFHVAKENVLLDDQIDERVKVIRHNQYVVLVCEDGDNWDYNDRMFWLPYGVDRIEKEIIDPIPSVPQVWTYAWEDRAFGDYDLNDCVIQARENADDDSKLDITLVALGATRDLWLGFDNKDAKVYTDYIPVFTDELHDVLGVSRGTMVNTGRASAQPVTKTIDKPAGFDFQTCSFILGAKREGDEVGIYENDYYSIRISTKGQDPHGLVIPGLWQWPKEAICVKDAYPDFKTWTSDHTKARDWYKNPDENKIVKI